MKEQIKIMNKHIWEGWTVGDFIKELELTFPLKKKRLKNKEDVKKWTASEQPYYKKHIPEVSNHFINLLKL